MIGGGLIFLILMALVATFFSRSLFKLLSVFVYSGIFSLLLMAGILLASNHADFVTRFNAYSASYAGSSDYYNQLISAASVPSVGFSWSETLNFLPVGAYSFIFVAAQQVMGGEIKNAQRVAYRAILTSMLISAGLTAVIIYLLEAVVGYNFLYSVSALSGSSSYVLPASPTYNFLIGILTQNFVLVTISQFLFLGWYLVTPPLGFLVVTRILMACSMDRVAPSLFAEVSGRFHTPYLATWVVAILGCVSLILYTLYASILANLSAILGVVLGSFLLVSIGAIVFPYVPRTKPIFESSPIQFRVLGIPLMTVAGILSTLVMLALTYMLATNSVYGANGPISIAAVAFEFISAFAILAGSYLYHKRRGLDLMLAFAQIPPE